jgi:site-specific recombinase XerC
MKKINRMAVLSGERAGQALPFRLTDLDLVDNCWAGSSRLQDVRNLAFLHVAYSTLLRISEISRIRVRDISRAEDGRIILDISHTKTIVMTGGLIKALSAYSSQRLNEWLKVSGLLGEPDAFLFCRVHRSNRALPSELQTLSRPAIEDIFRKAWRVAGQTEPVRANKNRYRQWT